MFHRRYSKPHCGGHHVWGGNERTSSLLNDIFSSLGAIHWRMDCPHGCYCTVPTTKGLWSQQRPLGVTAIQLMIKCHQSLNRRKTNISKIRKLLLVVAFINLTHLRSWISIPASGGGKIQEIPFGFPLLASGQQKTFERQRKTKRGNNARLGWDHDSIS